MKPWKVLSSSYAFKDRWVRLRTDTLQSPRGKVLEGYHTLETSNWVNIIAITNRQEVVLVEQYRPSVGRTQLELPGGLIDAGEQPEESARRELFEETGFAGGQWVALGTLDAMCSRMSGEFHTFVALGVSRQGQQQLEEYEEISVIEKPWPRFVADLPLRESTQMASLMLLHLYAAKSDDATIQGFGAFAT